MKKITNNLRQSFKNGLFSALTAVVLTSAVTIAPGAVADDHTNQVEQTEQVIALININQADIKGLMSLKGIGEKKAAAIVEYRNSHGAFNNIEDLTEVKGIGEAIINKNRASISI